MPGDPLDEMIEGAAKALGLPLDPAWKDSMRANLEVTLTHGANVAAFELPDEAEPAPVFRA
jgi:hypothetical protein